jgi:hypothetical protein
MTLIGTDKGADGSERLTFDPTGEVTRALSSCSAKPFKVIAVVGKGRCEREAVCACCCVRCVFEVRLLGQLYE